MRATDAWADLKDVTVCLPFAGRTGWGVCTENLYRTFSRLAPKWEWLTENLHLPYQRDRVIAAITTPTFHPWPNFIWGRVQCGYGFIEANLEMSTYAVNARRYWQHICCGSSWMRDQLISVGINNCSVAIQGVDHISPPIRRRPTNRNDFVVFSGGKFEFRKGQDVVISAMKVIMKRHRDVKLIVAWSSVNIRLMDTMHQSKLICYQRSGSTCEDRIAAILESNGLPLDRCEIVSICDNRRMPRIFGQCDLAIFPNRCEGGTNLVAMEAIACGLPSILSYSSGHKDIVSQDDPLLLRDMRPIEAYNLQGEVCGAWDEPNIEELIDRIDAVYSDRLTFGLLARQRAAAIGKFTWEETARRIGSALASI